MVTFKYDIQNIEKEITKKIGVYDNVTETFYKKDRQNKYIKTTRENISNIIRLIDDIIKDDIMVIRKIVSNTKLRRN